MTLDTITPEMPCPSVLGGPVRHYPRFEGDTPITLPGIGVGRLDRRDPAVLLALCGDALLRPTHDPDNQLSSEQAGDVRLCADCERARRGIKGLVPAAVPDAELAGPERDRERDRAQGRLRLRLVSG